jgi:sugar-specific transcriptional regulator TrmB
MNNMTENLTKYLEQLDLTQNDATVYLCVLKRGPSNPSAIAKDTGIKRARIYDSLKRLIERGFVVQDVERKRPIYMCNNPQLLVSELENQITAKTKAIEMIERELIETHAFKGIKGIFLYTTDASARLKLQELLEGAKKKVVIMAIIPQQLRKESFIPSKLLAEKVQEGKEVILLLNINEKNWEYCEELVKWKLQVYHFPKVNELTSLIHLIDDDSLCVSTYRYRANRIKLQYTFHFAFDKGIIQAFNFLLYNFIKLSVPLETRLEQLKDSIYPTEKLKSVFGVED